jgi:two-component system phosphate regulon sensor histidine kinase PhoR
MNGPGRLFWKLFLGNALIMAFVLGICAWIINREVSELHTQAIQEQLEAQAVSLRAAVERYFDPPDPVRLNDIAEQIAADQPHDTRVTFIGADGTVLGDSEADIRQMGSHDDRPEIMAALEHGRGMATRPSERMARPLRYVAVRVGHPDAPLGVVRVAMGLEQIGRQSEAATRLILGIVGAGVLAIVLFALGLAGLWSIPIRQITMTARSLSRGDLSARVKVTGRDEVGDLGRSLNQMRDNLASQLQTIDRQRRTLESMLGQLHEGVIVCGRDGRIVWINPAAVRLLGLSSGMEPPAITFEGLPVAECVSHPDLRALLLNNQQTRDEAHTEHRFSGSEGPIYEERIELRRGNERISLLARASEIRLPHYSGTSDEPGNRDRLATGRLLVLTDVSELTRMMQVRTDFAANASHELRTPLSAIRVAIETLQDIEFPDSAKAAHKFLQVADRHVTRMEDMVVDLLNLSRLESSQEEFTPQELNLRVQMLELRQRHAESLEGKHLKFTVDIAPECEIVAVNGHLLRLILDNLVDNAIKFTDEDGHIRVGCEGGPPDPGGKATIAIHVTDDGCGIPEEDQRRVFERFYQVERARTGSIRGTGLGLSIVRHAVAAMGGEVRLQSEVGKGTTVTLIVPQPE